MLGVFPPAVRCAYAVLGLLGVNTIAVDDVAFDGGLTHKQAVLCHVGHRKEHTLKTKQEYDTPKYKLTR